MKIRQITKRASRKEWWTANKKQLSQDATGYMFILPWIIGLLAFTAYPMIASVYLSFTNYSILKAPRWIGLANYENMFTKDPLFWKSVSNTAYFALLAVPLKLLIALLLAMLLAKKVRGIGVFRTIYYLPSLMPSVATTILFMFLLDPRSGIVNTVLTFFGFPRLGWLASSTWSKPALILMVLWAGSGWQMLVFLAGIKDIPHSLHEAAMIDGASAWKRFWKITIPLLTPTIYFNLIMGIINSFQIFAAAYVAAGGSDSAGLGSAGPLNSLLMYMVLLYRNAFRYFDMGYASAMAVALFVVLVTLTIIVHKTSNRWVFYESGQQS